MDIQWNITQPKKSNVILPFATPSMDLEGIMLSEISETEKDSWNTGILNNILQTEKKL